MSEFQPPTCADYQELLALDPDSFDRPDIRDHLASCATCNRMSAQYREIDILLSRVPDLKLLSNLAPRFQQIPQARRLADLGGNLAAWEGLVEEKPASRLSRSQLDTPPIISFLQKKGKKTMQRPPFDPDTESSPVLRHGQFQPPTNLAPRPRRSPWAAIVSVAVVLVVVVSISAWLLPSRQAQLGAPGNHVGTTPTTPSVTPTSPTSQPYAFTAADNGKTVSYPETTRFTVTLDNQQYPSHSLQLACNPQGAISITTGMAYAPPPLYTTQYQTIAPGTCTIQDGNFTLTVTVTGTTTTPTPTPGLTQQYAFTAADNGRTVRFTITSRFTLTLNQQVYPQANLRLVCNPQGAASATTGMPYASPPSYAVQYQVNEVGSCTIQNGNFTLTVIIEGL